jgi:GNAT superfamily N-acetyltransferase
MQTRYNALFLHGAWHTIDPAAPSCLVHVQDQRVQLGAWAAEPDEVVDLVVDAVDSLVTDGKDLTFAALDRQSIEPLSAALAATPRSYKRQWHSPCGLYRPTLEPSESAPLPDGAVLRPLRDADAALVDERWTYRSASSLDMIRSMIGTGVGCFGVEDASGSLCGWVCRYLDGPIGMLWVEEASRRHGYARQLLAHARRTLEEAGAPCFAYIVDGNVASETLFAREDWARVEDADWVGFGPRRVET